MSKSVHQIAIKGVDKTGAAFGSISAKARATGQAISRYMTSALAAAGAYLGMRKISEGINELGKLDDYATKTSMSVDDLTRTLTAFNILGIQNMSLETFAKTLDYMQKTTGRAGMSGFMQTLEEIGQIEDAAERGQMAMKIFGRSGMELMPLINAADQGTQALQGVINAMPAVPAAAAAAGDDMNDAMAQVGSEFHRLWLLALNAVLRLFSEKFNNDMRSAMAELIADFEFSLKMLPIAVETTWRRIRGFFNQIGGAIGNALAAAFSLENPLKGMKEGWENEAEYTRIAIEAIYENHKDRMISASLTHDRQLEDALNLSRNYTNASKSTGTRLAEYKAALAEIPEMAKSLPKVQNDLILAGSNEANKLSVLGPQFQSETKKQTKLQEQLAKDVKTIATAATTDDYPILEN